MSPRSPRAVVTFPIVLRELTVLRVADVNPGLRRITFGGEQLHAFHRDGLDLPALRTEGFDDHVKFFFPAEGADLPVLPRQNISSLDWPADARPIGKDYTPRRYDPAAGELEFDFVRHVGGPASTWAQQARTGQTAWIAGPKMSDGHPEGVDWLLVFGDETALPAIGRWLAEMPESTRAKVFVEVADEAHRQELPTRADAEIAWLYRDGRPAGTTDLLEQAVRNTEWLPGTVFVWAAGEAVTLKPIRRYLRERDVPREHMSLTGYWRRTEPLPGVPEPDPDETHDRLHELTDLAPGFAIRAAVTLGLIEEVQSGNADAAGLARRTGTDPGTLAALLAYLVAIEVLTVDEAGRHGLAPLGEELAEDDHAVREYHLDGARAALDLSLAGLAGTVRTGRAADGALAAAVRRDGRLGEEARAAVEEIALWVAPSLVDAHDWASVPSLTVAGNGAGSIANALVRNFPALGVRIVGLPSAVRVLRDQILDVQVELIAQTDPVPPAGDTTYLLVNPLTWLEDEDAVEVLRATAANLSAANLPAANLPAAGRLLLVEQVLSDDPEDVLQHLQLKCAFGSGLRTTDRIAELTAAAGLRTVHSVEIGWSHHLWVLGPAGQR
ncbi:MAG: siderophore-interacting protein [Streptosporangiaceae bacterium]